MLSSPRFELVEADDGVAVPIGLPDDLRGKELRGVRPRG